MTNENEKNSPVVNLMQAINIGFTKMKHIDVSTINGANISHTIIDTCRSCTVYAGYRDAVTWLHAFNQIAVR